jgi:SPW repeat
MLASWLEDADMTYKSLLKDHRSWEDWLGMGLGALLVVSPWLVPVPVTGDIAMNAVAVGLLLVVLSFMELYDRHRWDEALQLACGVWMIAAPFALGYANSGALMIWHVAIGIAVAALALLQFNQPSKLAL